MLTRHPLIFTLTLLAASSTMARDYEAVLHPSSTHVLRSEIATQAREAVQSGKVRVGENPLNGLPGWTSVRTRTQVQEEARNANLSGSIEFGELFRFDRRRFGG